MERDALCLVLARQNKSDKITGYSLNVRLKPTCSGTQPRYLILTTRKKRHQFTRSRFMPFSPETQAEALKLQSKLLLLSL